MDNALLPVLYQDEHLIVIDKPGGMLVHRSFIDRHETRFVMQTLRDQIGQHVYPVHRLDKPTSGCLLLALDPVTANLLSQMFVEHQITKEYHALARGHVQGSGVIDYPLSQKLDKLGDKQVKQQKPAQEAVTEFQTLQHLTLPFAVGKYPEARYSLVKLMPKTGRKHQLRRHLHHISHPIIGDTTHGDGKHNQLFKQTLSLSGLFLRATGLSFVHPHSRQRVHCSPEWSSPWIELFSLDGWVTV